MDRSIDEKKRCLKFVGREGEATFFLHVMTICNVLRRLGVDSWRAGAARDVVGRHPTLLNAIQLVELILSLYFFPPHKAATCQFKLIRQ